MTNPTATIESNGRDLHRRTRIAPPTPVHENKFELLEKAREVVADHPAASLIAGLVLGGVFAWLTSSRR